MYCTLRVLILTWYRTDFNIIKHYRNLPIYLLRECILQNSNFCLQLKSLIPNNQYLLIQKKLIKPAQIMTENCNKKVYILISQFQGFVQNDAICMYLFDNPTIIIIRVKKYYTPLWFSLNAVYVSAHCYRIIFYCKRFVCT